MQNKNIVTEIEKNPYPNTFLENFPNIITLEEKKEYFNKNIKNEDNITEIRNRFGENIYTTGKININSSQQGLGKTTSILNLMKKYTTQIKKKDNKKFVFFSQNHNFLKDDIINQLKENNIEYIYLRYPLRDNDLCPRFKIFYNPLAVKGLPMGYICDICKDRKGKIKNCEMTKIMKKIKTAKVVVTVYDLTSPALKLMKNIDYIIYDEEVERETELFQPDLDIGKFDMGINFLKN